MSAPAPKRRWFRYSLRTLLVVVTLGAFVVSWIAYELNWIRERRAVLASGWCGVAAEQAPGMLWLFGEDGYSFVFKFGSLSPEDRAALARIEWLFPEAVVRK